MTKPTRQPRKSRAKGSQATGLSPEDEFEAAWPAAVDFIDAEAELQRGGGSHFRRAMERKRDEAAQKLTPGAKAQAIERNRAVVVAMLAELRSGETNLARIVRRVKKATGARVSTITARRLLKRRFGLTGKPGCPRDIKIK